MKISLKSGFALVIVLVVAAVVAFILIKTRAPLEHVVVAGVARRLRDHGGYGAAPTG